MLDDNEIWEKVKSFKGNKLCTYVKNSYNEIIDVNDDEILIKGRKTKPTKSDVINAYKLLFKKGELERKRDLAELAQINKQTSSIVFRIVGELAKEEIIILNKPIILKLKSHIEIKTERSI